MKKRSGFTVMVRLAGLVKPLAGFMVLAIAMGLAGHLCASFLTIFGAYGVLEVLGPGALLSLPALFAAMVIFALLRGALRYGEQTWPIWAARCKTPLRRATACWICWRNPPPCRM